MFNKTNNKVTPVYVIRHKDDISFYIKLFVLYILNVSDFIFTEILTGTGLMVEGNPIMVPFLDGFWGAFILKVVVMFVIVAIVSIVFHCNGGKETKAPKVIIWIGLIAYILVNLWHLFWLFTIFVVG